MPTHVSQPRAVEALADVWGRLGALLGTLADADWQRPTSLPGWTVKDTVAHVVGTEAMLLGEPVPAVDLDRAARPHVRNDIGALNEQWVLGLADEDPAALLERFHDHTARRLGALRATEPAAWDAEGFTPAGTDTYGRFMRIRTFDCWLHEQDIRDAIGTPGGDGGPAAELALDEMAGIMGYVVGKRAGAPSGSRVRFVLTGPAARTIEVEVGDRACVVPELAAPPNVTLTMPVGVFARLCGGRVDPQAVRAEVAIEAAADAGRAVGERIARSMAFTI